MPVVLRYVEEMKGNRWKEDTGEMIKISKTGLVLDGQHRLYAVVKSGISINFHVIEDMDDKIFDVIDIGSKRSASDIFFIDNVKYSNVIPSTIQFYESLKYGSVSTKTQINSKHSTTKLLELYHEKHKFWDDVVKKSTLWYSNFSKILQPSTIGGMYALFSEIDEVDALNFMNQLCTGINITNNSICLLRNKLTDDRISNFKMTHHYRNAIIIRNWNYFRENVKVSKIVYDSEKHSFPIPR